MNRRDLFRIFGGAVLAGVAVPVVADAEEDNSPVIDPDELESRWEPDEPCVLPVEKPREGFYCEGREWFLQHLADERLELFEMLMPWDYRFNPAHRFMADLSTIRLRGRGFGPRRFTSERVISDGVARHMPTSPVVFPKLKAGKTIGGAVVAVGNQSKPKIAVAYYWFPTTDTCGGDITIQHLEGVFTLT